MHEQFAPNDVEGSAPAIGRDAANFRLGAFDSTLRCESSGHNLRIEPRYMPAGLVAQSMVNTPSHAHARAEISSSYVGLRFADPSDFIQIENDRILLGHFVHYIHENRLVLLLATGGGLDPGKLDMAQKIFIRVAPIDLDAK